MRSQRLSMKAKKKKIRRTFKRINEDIRVREKKTEAKIAGIEKLIDTKIKEKFTDLEVRIRDVEKQIRSKRKDLPRRRYERKSTNCSNRMQSSSLRIQRGQLRKRRESCGRKNDQSDGNERSGVYDRLPCSSDYTCLCGIPEHEDQRQLRQISKYAKS